MPPFISHQEHLIGICSQKGIVHSLVDQPLLLPGGLWGKGYGNLIAFPIHSLAKLSHKGRIAFPVLGKNVFKIHIHPRIALFPYGF